MNIAIIQYQAGNIQSLLFALERLGYKARLTVDPQVIRSADKVILPGVGNAAAAMQALSASGLQELIPRLKQPVLGICLGMQLLARWSQEGDTSCLGIINSEVKKFSDAPGYKVPHMGWNNLRVEKGSLLKGISGEPHVYYVHSYYMPVGAYTLASSCYPEAFSAIVQQDNFYGIQFHPEKSGEPGQRILDNFLKLGS